jgi:hypothetical protein
MDAPRRGVKPIKADRHDPLTIWGLTAHGLFILQCSNYLFLVELYVPR